MPRRSKAPWHSLGRFALSAIMLAAGAAAQAQQSSAPAAPVPAMSNKDWWPNRLDLSPLRQQNAVSSPMGADFNYAREFKKLDLKALKSDIEATLTESQDWWPADFGNYGPFFIRMAWHSAGTYRAIDGRGGSDGGQQRFDPLNNWPDNVNLDKARRLLWPIKQKYGAKISWGDLMVLAGTVAMESMGMQTFGFAGGRADDWEPDLVYWGPEREWLGDSRHKEGRQLKGPLAAVQMGLIYVNPEGPNGNPDPLAAARDIRESFGRMGMNDEETVALIAGGHTFGKSHGAHRPEKCLAGDPTSSPIEQQGLGWKNSCGKGNAEDTVSSGLEGSWTSSPTLFTKEFLSNLFAYHWVKTKSPAGATQWKPAEAEADTLVPDAHIKDKSHPPMMFTTDLALRFDPVYEKISRSFLDNPRKFETAFAKAWFKLTHRDLGPRSRYLGADVPKEVLLWQDPLPEIKYKQIDAGDIKALKARILASGLTTSQLVRTAWASAASFRGSDMRGGANGARLQLAPQKDWAANNPAELAQVLARLGAIRKDFNATLGGGKQVSMADVIVLGGTAAVEAAAQKAGYKVQVAFTPGRADATQEQTDVTTFAVLEPKADGFRNYYSKDAYYPPVQALVDKASLLRLTPPEMTVLVGGLRALDANADGSRNGVLTDQPGTLNNAFFVNLLNMSTVWRPASTEGLYEGRDRKTGQVKWTATPVDLIFGSNSELRAISERYASDDAKEPFVQDFAKAWTKVMDLDRFDRN